MWYKLDGDDIIPLGKIEDLVDPEVLRELAAMEKKENRRQNVTILTLNLDGKEIATVRVSTVFLRLDHSFMGDTPVLFETMVFVDDMDTTKIQFDEDEFLGGYEPQIRYHTVAGARKGHEKIVEHVKNELIKKEMGEVKVENIHLSL